jgi:signal peptidase I
MNKNTSPVPSPSAGPPASPASPGSGESAGRGPGRPAGRRRAALFLVVAVLGVLVAVGIWTESRHRYQPLRVTGGSMRPTYAPGDSVLVRKHSAAGPHSGDVVLVKTPEWGTPGPYLQRVIGVGGDHVVLPVGGPLTVNGRTVKEPYVLGGVANGRTAVDVTVPPGHLFLLGDHRADSADARAHLDRSGGALPDADVVGRVLPDNHAAVPYFATSVAAALVAAVAAALSLSALRTTRPGRRPAPMVTWGRPPRQR